MPNTIRGRRLLLGICAALVLSACTTHKPAAGPADSSSIPRPPEELLVEGLVTGMGDEWDLRASRSGAILDSQAATGTSFEVTLTWAGGSALLKFGLVKLGTWRLTLGGELDQCTAGPGEAVPPSGGKPAQFTVEVSQTGPVISLRTLREGVAAKLGFRVPLDC